MKKIAIVFGTRPEIIKLSKVIELADKNFELHTIYTGQHYDELLSDKIKDSLGVKNFSITISLENKSNSAAQLGEMVEKVSHYLFEKKIECVVVQGDTNSTLAGALAAKKLGIKLVHIEAGVRSGDMKMPEEQNRIIVDSVSDMNFAINDQSLLVLKSINPSAVNTKIDNTIFEVCHSVASKLENSKQKNVFVTVHRKENLNSENLNKIFALLEIVSSKYHVVFPMHPGTLAKISDLGIKMPKSIEVIEPVDYVRCIEHIKNSFFCITDSGGITEEGPCLGIPVFVYREQTEQIVLLEKGKIQLIRPSLLRVEKLQISELENQAKKMQEVKLDFNLNVSQQIIENIKKLIN